MRAILSISILLFLGAASTAHAQLPKPGDETDPLENMPIRLGPLGLTPTVAITDVGIDSNVFNDAANPQSDFTITVTPRLQARLRAQQLLFSGSVGTGLVYFQKFDDERSIDYAAEGRVDVGLRWFRPYVLGNYTDTRQRLNAELDVRAPRTSTTVAGGAHLQTPGRLAFVFEARRTNLTFSEGTFFEGVLLSQVLNSKTQIYDAGIEFALTPLTTLTLTASQQTDRFPDAPDRDSDTFRIMPSLRMEAPAIVQGSLAVGYRKFDTLDPTLPDFTGLVVQGTLTHTFAERTKLDLFLFRDVQYSFEIEEPYYLSTGLRLTLTQQLQDQFDVRLIGGRERLDYRDAAPPPEDPTLPAVTDAVSRTDRVDTIGVGFGYRIRPTLRLGFDVEYARRESDRADRRYDRTRAFASVTYGL